MGPCNRWCYLPDDPPRPVRYDCTNRVVPVVINMWSPGSEIVAIQLAVGTRSAVSGRFLPKYILLRITYITITRCLVSRPCAARIFPPRAQSGRKAIIILLLTILIIMYQIFIHPKPWPKVSCLWDQSSLVCLTVQNFKLNDGRKTCLRMWTLYLSFWRSRSVWPLCHAILRSILRLFDWMANII